MLGSERLHAGTNVDIGRKILANSGYNIVTADDLDDAAQKAVASLSSLKK
jgi:succinyl-CoA synthetase beta subunit